MKCTTGSDSADARTTKKKKRTSQIEHYDRVFRRIPMLAGADIIRVRIAATVGKQTTNQAPACTGVRCLFVFDCVPFSASPFPPTPSLCLLFPDLFRDCFLTDCFVLSLRIQSETLHLSLTSQFHVLFLVEEEDGTSLYVRLVMRRWFGTTSTLEAPCWVVQSSCARD